MVGGLAAAGLLFWSAGARWASGRGATASGQVIRGHLSGRSVAPLVAAAALVAVAGAVAIPATRRRGRVVIGVAVFAAGAAAVAEALVRRRTGVSDLRHQLPAGAHAHASGWPYLAVAGGVLLALVGVWVAVRGPGWTALSSRYEAPGAAPRVSPPARNDVASWDALDRGEDPTASQR